MRYTRKNKKGTIEIHFEPLEPRLLFSADLPAVEFDVKLSDSLLVQEDNSLYQIFEQTYSDPSIQNVIYERHELVLIDEGVEDHQQLMKEIIANSDQDQLIEFAIISSNSDGISQITNLLTLYQDLDSIHIVSHGQQGQLTLGDGYLGIDNIDDYTEQLLQWQQATKDTADINFYGCDLAGSVEGKVMLRTLSALTGADIAASVDITGSENLGGDWELEYNIGDIELGVMSPQNFGAGWQGTLSSTPQGSETLVNAAAAGTQRDSDAAMNATGDYVIVWEEDRDIFAQRYDSLGVPQGGGGFLSIQQLRTIKLCPVLP